MGLDKWLEPEEDVKKKGKEKKDINAEESDDSITKKLSKFKLICSNRKCKYQKTFMKKLLTEKDKTCPRCSSVMKVQKLN